MNFPRLLSEFLFRRGVAAILRGLPCLVLMFGLATVSAQEYPAKSIRIITSEPGGGNDFAARLVAPGLTIGLGQQVVIENRPGIIATEMVAKAPADGYTLLFAGNALWISPLLRARAWDPVKDFAPVSVIMSAPLLLVVHPSLPVKSVRELVALAKSRPGALNYSTGPIGVTNHLAGELFKSVAAVNIVHIPYKGNGPANNALLGGEVQVMFGSLGPALPHMKSGRLRALAVTTAEPSALVPGLPTVAQTVPGMVLAIPTGAWAPARTPEAIVKRLAAEIQRIINQPDIREKFVASGAEVVGSTPEYLDELRRADMARLSKVIKDAGIREE